jgi:amidase
VRAAKLNTPLYFQSAVSQLEALDCRSCTSLDLVEMYIDRIERLDGVTNAVVSRRFADAREEAIRSDAGRMAGNSPRPLEGLPMTVKESFAVTGLPTTWGLPHLKGNIASSDALAVQRLKRAGAVILGKTNVPELLADWQTFNELYGVTSNPWNPQHSPGGSSGGSAVAMAAGYAALELGSDIGASIRGPAHFCGVYGHKPTYGIASPLGQAAHPMRSVPDLSVIGPLARSAEDLALALSVIAGPDTIDGRGWRLELPRSTLKNLEEARIGIVLKDEVCPPGAEVTAALTRLTGFLRSAGALVTEIRMPVVEPADLRRLYLTMLRAATSRAHDAKTVRRFVTELADVPEADHSYWTLARRAVVLSHREWLQLNERRHQFRFQCDTFFERCDVLITPIASTAAWQHDQSEPRHERTIQVDEVPSRSIEQLYWAAFATLAYLPATAVPIGASAAGLPIGAQIIGPQYADQTTLWLARELEQRFHAYIAPPGY